MKKSYIFCLLALFTHISMAQIDPNKEWSMSYLLTQLFPSIDTVEIKSNDQTYQIIKLSKGVTVFQNKESTLMNDVPKDSSDKKYKADEIFQLFQDSISLYINPGTSLADFIFFMYITPDIKGNIKDIVFIYISDQNIPGYVLSNIEREIKIKSRLIFEITPSTKIDDAMIYSCMIRKDGLIPLGN